MHIIQFALNLSRVHPSLALHNEKYPYCHVNTGQCLLEYNPIGKLSYQIHKIINYESLKKNKKITVSG